MLFHTHEFFALLLVTLVAYRLLPAARSPVLLIASIVFYAYAGLEMTLLFFGVMLFNYACYLRISEGRGARWLWLAVIVDLANLFTFKYTSFFVTTLASLGLAPADAEQWTIANLVLPVGISFYTFQLMALLIDAYHGSQPRVRSLGQFFLFIMFFGHMIAGPVMRGHEFLPQLVRFDLPSRREAAAGVGYFLIGLVKKALIADLLLAPHAEHLFADAVSWDTPTSWFLGILFGFQIYFDFAGYCDMAIGIGKFFGIQLKVNFATPYVSKTPSEFWNRWNITLSRWFGDYVFVPLGGSRVGLPRTVVNLMITMLVSGLWHGAGFTFLVWGGLHGAYLSAYHVLRRRFPSFERLANGSLASPPAFAMWLLTYVVGTIGWVYFRASSVAEANAVVANMFGFGTGTERGPLAEYGLVAGVLLLAHFAEAAAWQRWDGWLDAALGFWRNLPGPVQALATAPILFLLLALTKDVQGAFIYFQF